MQLSPHFSLAELTVSEVAARAGLANSPNEMTLEHMKVLAQGLELCRTALGHPIHVNSGYRSSMVNSMIGGVANSAHVLGYAADITCEAFGTPRAVAGKLAASLSHYDQIIFEYNSWVHVSFDPQNRRQLLTKAVGEPYVTGLIS